MRRRGHSEGSGTHLRAVPSALLVLLLAACATTQVSGPGSAEGDAAAGEIVYDQHCASCHGARGGGSAQGPALVDATYRPSRHADFAFFAAVRNGVRAHHWDFGPMPPIDGLTDDDVTDIVAYVRQLQEGAGIR